MRVFLVDDPEDDRRNALGVEGIMIGVGDDLGDGRADVPAGLGVRLSEDPVPAGAAAGRRGDDLPVRNPAQFLEVHHDDVPLERVGRVRHVVHRTVEGVLLGAEGHEHDRSAVREPVPYDRAGDLEQDGDARRVVVRAVPDRVVGRAVRGRVAIGVRLAGEPLPVVMRAEHHDLPTQIPVVPLQEADDIPRGQDLPRQLGRVRLELEILPVGAARGGGIPRGAQADRPELRFDVSRGPIFTGVPRAPALVGIARELLDVAAQVAGRDRQPLGRERDARPVPGARGQEKGGRGDEASAARVHHSGPRRASRRSASRTRITVFVSLIGSPHS